MKKLLCLFLLIPFLLTSCDFLEQIKSNMNSIISNVENPNAYQNDDDYTNDSLKANGPYTTHALPSKGNVKVLVVPVNFDSNKKTDTYLDKLEIAFNGTEDQTGWESVKTYYKKASYGKLDLSFDVLDDWYTPVRTKEYYQDFEDPYDDGSTVLLREILNHFDNEIDFSQYDSDSDGYVDSVWMIYNNVSSSTSPMWWAFSFVNQTSDKWDGKRARFYAFAGVDFLTYDHNLKVDASTYIHETGHLFGLEDYYSYSSQNTGGVFGLDMMDSDLGDHCSISKILLGWASPTIITDTTTIDISSFVETGEVLLIANHELLTIYDEYILIDFYTPTSINEYHNVFRNLSEKAYGVRVYHIDASINLDEEGVIQFNGGDYSTAFKYDNSDGDKNFVDLLKANSESLHDANINRSYRYLYTEDSKQFGIDIYSGFRYHDGTALNFQMVVNSITETKANITITFK